MLPARAKQRHAERIAPFGLRPVCDFLVEAVRKHIVLGADGVVALARIWCSLQCVAARRFAAVGAGAIAWKSRTLRYGHNSFSDFRAGAHARAVAATFVASTADAFADCQHGSYRSVAGSQSGIAVGLAGVLDRL